MHPLVLAATLEDGFEGRLTDGVTLMAPAAWGTVFLGGGDDMMMTHLKAPSPFLAPHIMHITSFALS